MEESLILFQPPSHDAAKRPRTSLKPLSRPRTAYGPKETIRTLETACMHNQLRRAVPRGGDRGLTSCPLPHPLNASILPGCPCRDPSDGAAEELKKIL